MYAEYRKYLGRQANGFITSIDWEEKEIDIQFYKNQDGSTDECECYLFEFKDNYTEKLGGYWDLPELESGTWGHLAKRFTKP